ncbi:heme peroxidase, partial [Chytriomyces sp. MP71]
MAAAQWSELRSAVYSRVAARGFGAAVVRLAWTDASSFGNNTNNTTNTNTTNSGGAHAQNVALKGSPQPQRRRPSHTPLLSADDNGLGEAVALLAPLAQSYALSTADLWSFAAAVVVANSGGPSIKWRPGRADAVDALDAPFPVFGGTSPVRLKPDFTAKDIRNAFANRMGFTDRETVALMGAHSMGIAKLNNTGYSGAWTLTPSYLSNQYFVQLSLNTTYNLQSITALDNSTKTQYVNSRGLMLLPSDMALTQDASYLAIVQEYATDQTLFLNDFGSAFTKLLELGLPPPATA